MALTQAPLAVLSIWLASLFSSPQLLQQLLISVYVLLLGTVVLYGFHRYFLIFVYYRHQRKLPRPVDHFDTLPAVTIQLPVFNERYVVERVIEAACAIEYPRDKLQIQVLDDSTDDTGQIAEECIRRMSLLGHNVSYLHRDCRRGFKAGALSDGLPQASGEFVAIFDADFVPEPDFLIRTIHFFCDPKIGVVQSRWGHINRDSSLLTKSQAMLLDGHFILEHIARNRSGRFMSFNGTAGIWRKTCIEDAGGWQSDTLTEDLDLSYRAQLRGWQFVYLPEVISPAELPPEMNAFKVQQFRWTKGAVQTARKILPTVLRSPLPVKVKIEALFHLTNWVVYPAMVLLTLLLFPAFLIRISPFSGGGVGQIFFDLTVFNLATVSVSIFYLCSQFEIYCSWWDKLKYLPFLMSLGVGICVNNAKAVIEGLFGKDNDFISTPKFGVQDGRDRSWRSKASLPRRQPKLMPYVEFLFGLYLLACIIGTVVRYRQITISIPFLALFGVGYFYVSLMSFYGSYVSRVRRKAQIAKPAGLPIA